MVQLQAAYILEGIYKLFLSVKNAPELIALYKQLTYFDAQFTSPNLPVSHPNLGVASVFDNIVSRGLPTKASVFVEDKFERLLGLSQKDDSDPQVISHKLKDHYLSDELFRALHIIDPQLKSDDFKFTNADHKKFIEEYVDKHIGEYAVQLFSQTQNLHDALQYEETPEAHKLYEHPDYKFTKKRNNISVNIPYGTYRSLAIELSTDNTGQTYSQDLNEKKKAIEQAIRRKFIEFRIRTSESNNLRAKKQLTDITSVKYFATLAKNYRTPLSGNTRGNDAMQLILAPVAIARIHKILAKLIIANKLDIRAKKWRIAVLERDISITFLAIEDFKQTMQALLNLQGKRILLPEIELSVFSSDQFSQSKLNHGFKTKIEPLENYNKNIKYDVLIDFSILRRSNLPEQKIKSRAKELVIARSAHFLKSFSFPSHASRVLYFQDGELDKLKKQSAQLLLQNIFRKKSFLPNQIEAISAILSGKNTLVNTPPNTGKSLIYQYVSILQPGISVVVHPNMAVMKNQFYQLKMLQIDQLIFSNSYKRNNYQKELAVRKLENGRSMFAFVSSDMLKSTQIQHVFGEFKKKKQYISHLIVDEAQTVSPWSHQFKVLDQNLVAYIQPYLISPNKLVCIGLSATLSYNSTADVVSELNIEKIISADYKNLIETNFKISKPVKSSYNYNTNGQDVLENVTNERIQAINQYFEQKTNTDNKSVLLFSAATDIDININPDLLEKVDPKDGDTGRFYGSVSYDNVLLDGRKAYESKNDIELFSASKISQLLGSDSFGTGLDIPGIENLVFSNIPGSIHSLYQTVGRVGRKLNKRDIEFIYFNNQSFISDSKTDIVHQGEYISKNVRVETYPDVLISDRQINLKYRGLKKEWNVLSELLNTIEYPTHDFAAELRELFKNEFDIQLRLETEPQINPFQLYFFDNESDIGYIDYKNNKIEITASSLKKAWAEKVLQFAFAEIDNLLTDSETVFQKFKEIPQQKTMEGLWFALEQQNTAPLVIPFENNGIRLLQQFFVEEIGLEYTIAELTTLYAGSESSLDFYNHFNKKNKLDVKVKESLEVYYNKIRIFNDTALALSRLEQQGIIQNLKINIAEQTFSVQIVKSKRYNKNLNLFAKAHFTDDLVAKQMNAIDNSSLKEHVVSVLKAYLKLFYEHVVKNQHDSVRQINNLITQLAKTTKTQKQKNLEMNQIFKLYSTAVFANETFHPSLVLDSQYFRKADPQFIAKAVNWAAFDIDKWNHLKKSAEILLKQYKSNYHLLLLYSIAGFITTKNIEEETYLFDFFMDGLENLRKKENDTRIKQYQYLKVFLKLVYDKKSALKGKLENIVLIKSQNKWLSEFNKQFLEDYSS